MQPTIEPAPHPRVLAALLASGVTPVVHRHADSPEPIQRPEDFARWLGRPVGAITKSLFLELRDGGVASGFAIAVCPVPMRVDFATLARRWNVTSVALGSRGELATVLEYPPTGVSPLGVKGLPVAIDEAVFGYETVLVGGGVAGVEVEIAPADLQRACGAARLAFAHN